MPANSDDTRDSFTGSPPPENADNAGVPKRHSTEEWVKATRCERKGCGHTLWDHRGKKWSARNHGIGACRVSSCGCRFALIEPTTPDPDKTTGGPQAHEPMYLGARDDGVFSTKHIFQVRCSSTEDPQAHSFVAEVVPHQPISTTCAMCIERMGLRIRAIAKAQEKEGLPHHIPNKPEDFG